MSVWPPERGEFRAGGFMYKVVRTSRLYEQIVQQIEDSILKGTLKAGDQLPSERELALKFGVSRTAVREAVKALHEKGLVEAYSGRGTFITDGTTEAVRQSINLMMRIDQTEGSENLAEVRQILEPEIAALAATRIQEPQLVLMREAFTVMNDALKDPDAYIEADLDFHLALAEAAENPLILSLLDSIVGLLHEQRIRIFFEDGGPQHGQYHHARILAAIERRDAEASRAAMRRCRAPRCATICSRSGKIHDRIRAAARFATQTPDKGEERNGQFRFCRAGRDGQRDGEPAAEQRAHRDGLQPHAHQGTALDRSRDEMVRVAARRVCSSGCHVFHGQQRKSTGCDHGRTRRNPERSRAGNIFG